MIIARAGFKRVASSDMRGFVDGEAWAPRRELPLSG